MSGGGALVPRQREFPTFTLSDMLGSLGGYAGLLIGWSIYSAVELAAGVAPQLIFANK